MSRVTVRRSLGSSFVAGAILLVVAKVQVPTAAAADQVPAPRVVYEKTFEKPPGDEWSKNDIEATPVGGRSFLGRFGGEQVSLSLGALPPHKFLKVSFTLFIVDTADGSHAPPWGPDVWDLSVAGGPSLLHTTFDNCGMFVDNNEQAFPDEFPQPPGKPWPGWTGADEKNNLGYVHAWGGPDRTFDCSSVYKLAFTFPHDADAIKLLFTSYSTETKRSEGWGIEHIRIESTSEPVPADPTTLERLWQELGGDDPLRALHAKWDLVSAGQTAETFLVKKLAPTEADSDQVAALVATLGDADSAAREHATTDLVTLGPSAVPELTRLLHHLKTPESRARVNHVLAAIQLLADTAPEALLRARAAHALRVLRGEPNDFTPEQNGITPPPAPTPDVPNPLAN